MKPERLGNGSYQVSILLGFKCQLFFLVKFLFFINIFLHIDQQSFLVNESIWLYIKYQI